MISAIFYLIAVFCAVWVIYQVWAVNTKLNLGGKLVWTVFALIFNILTAIVYYFIGRK